MRKQVRVMCWFLILKVGDSLFCRILPRRPTGVGVGHCEKSVCLKERGEREREWQVQGMTVLHGYLFTLLFVKLGPLICK